MAAAVAQIQQNQFQRMQIQQLQEQQEQQLQQQPLVPANTNADTSQPPLMSGQPQAWTASMDLERRLKAELRKRGFWDMEVRRLRHNLQKAYETVIFTNFVFAQVLWAQAWLSRWG